MSRHRSPHHGSAAVRAQTRSARPPRLSRVTQEIFEELGRTYPQARCELDFTTPFELLIATVLSAQSTDRRVNSVTPELFRRWPDAAALAGAEEVEVAEVIKPTGFFRAKSTRIIALAAQLVADHDGDVPGDLASLVALPGVGRKTANVVLSDAFGVPGITADTHLIRLAGRFGWTDSDKPEVVEAEVGELFDRSDWNQLNHRVIWHGRRCCHARRPACGACSVAQWCPAYGIGETDPDVAATLIKEPRR
ncbi:endonuclease III [Parenemella sanctibonifatiensis]|uniref:Endonuclease III n=1 Tax=Parenemella sanctibonifatiensis TaxID=2016505 RepID=A0A255EN55_9ACTN|nr:endonuclease III [Parenemella sanctibonifatiensis]